MERLIVFGAGKMGEYVAESILPGMEGFYSEIVYFDNDVNRQGKLFYQYYIVTQNEYESLIRQEGISLIIAMDCWQEVLKECRLSGVEEKIIAIFNRHTKGNPYIICQYSQEGEELYLAAKFSGTTSGFYVDVGAHHPYRFSNTYWAYKLGWNGINIEPNADSIGLFNRVRKRDINLCCGISSRGGVMLDYYKFDEPALNTFKPKEFQGLRIPKEVVKVPVYRLDEIFRKYKVDYIDFISIDVEGYELEVLQSNDWERYIPQYVLVEQKGLSYHEIADTEIYQFLVNKGYECDWKSLRTVIYKRV